MVVVPQVPSRHIVVVAELGGESSRDRVPLGTDDGFAGIVKELGVAVELEIGMAAMEVGDDRHTIGGDRVLRVPMESVGPVQ